MQSVLQLRLGVHPHLLTSENVPLSRPPIRIKHPPRLLLDIGVRVVVQPFHRCHYPLLQVGRGAVSQSMESLVSHDAALVPQHLEHPLPHLGDVLPHMAGAQLPQCPLPLQRAGVKGPLDVF